MLTASDLKTDWVSIPAVLVTGLLLHRTRRFFPSMAVSIASTHSALLWRDGQAELAWVAWLNTKMVYLQKVTHLCTNLAQCRVTL